MFPFCAALSRFLIWCKVDGWMDVHFGWLSMEFVGRKRKHQWIPTCPTLHGWYGASGGAYGDNDGVNDDELSDDEEDVDGALVRPGVPKSGVGEARGQIFRWHENANDEKTIKKKSSIRNITSLLGDNGRQKPGYRHSWSPGQVIVIITMRILHRRVTITVILVDISVKVRWLVNLDLETGGPYNLTVHHRLPSLRELIISFLSCSKRWLSLPKKVELRVLAGEVSWN